MTETVIFDTSSITTVESMDFHEGEHIKGCKVTGPLTDAPDSVREIQQIQPAIRSYPINSFLFEQGNFIDISYTQSSKNTDTPYRVSQLSFGRWSEYRQQTSQAKRREFVAVLEPVAQQAGLLLLIGFEAEYMSGEQTIGIFDTYMKHPWSDPYLHNLEDMYWFQSKFEDAGFTKKKDRDVEQISVVFDEIVAEYTDLQTDLFATVI